MDHPELGIFRTTLCLCSGAACHANKRIYFTTFICQSLNVLINRVNTRATNKIRKLILISSCWQLCCPSSKAGKLKRHFSNGFESRSRAGVALFQEGGSRNAPPISVSGTRSFLSCSCPVGQLWLRRNLKSQTTQAKQVQVSFLCLPVTDLEKCGGDKSVYKHKNNRLTLPGARVAGTARTCESVSPVSSSPESQKHLFLFGEQR